MCVLGWWAGLAGDLISLVSFLLQTYFWKELRINQKHIFFELKLLINLHKLFIQFKIDTPFHN